MFQYVLALLLINTYYQSLGNVIPQVEQHTISKALHALVNQCDNKFVLEQINKSQDCYFEVPPNNALEIQCLMFYDINKQLCSAVAASKLKLNEDYADKINQSQNINMFCSSMKDIHFTNLSQFPIYIVAEKVFENTASCGKLCGYGDITNEDTTYYCKYYMWGLNMLKNQTNAPTSTVINETGVSLSDADTGNADIAVSGITGPNVQKPILLPQGHTDKEKLPTVNGDETGEGSTANKNIQAPNKGNTDKGDNKDHNGDNKDENNSVIDQGRSPSIENDNTLNIDNETNANLVSDNLGHETNKDTKDNTGSKEVLEKPGNVQNDQDKDTEDIIGGSQEEDEGSLDPDQDQDGLEQPETKDTVGISPKGYTHAEVEEYTDEGDNFFPFFLTAVVLVVLLYVLYHNKNKVTKLFFGLMLEGRAGNRRRNSRGHAYRRLDTLEQAMSAQSALPPSKIIY